MDGQHWRRLIMSELQLMKLKSHRPDFFKVMKVLLIRLAEMSFKSCYVAMILPLLLLWCQFEVKSLHLMSLFEIDIVISQYM